jgi:acyl carrier protein
MTETELRERLLAILGGIAPEAREIDIDPEQSFRDQLDIDSMDFLNFVTAVHKQLGVPIPELDYPRLASLNGAVHYVLAKLPG